MKESFKNRAIENLEAAELLFENGKYNASANRDCYAAFHLAIYMLYKIDIVPTIDHKTIQALFSDYYFNRRKVLPSIYKRYLSELQMIRNTADYYDGILKKQASKQLKMTKEFFEVLGEMKWLTINKNNW